jgi:hypothetical protein
MCHLSSQLSSVSDVDSCHLSLFPGFRDLNQPSTTVPLPLRNPNSEMAPSTESMADSLPLDPTTHVISGFWVPGVRNSRPQNTCHHNPRIPEPRNTEMSKRHFTIFRVSQLRGFSMQRPLAPCHQDFWYSNPELPKSQNSSLNNSFRDSGVRVTKDFGLHSGLTNSESPK